MRRIISLFTLAVLVSLASLDALAYDIAVENGEGVTIYYNYINDGSELEVTYKSGSGLWNYHPRTYGYEDIEKVTVPSIVNYSGKNLQVTGIGAHAFDCFSGMGGTTECNFKLSTISLPDNIKYIGDEAFEGCKKMKSINIPSNVSSIGNSAFSCSGLEHITIPSTVTTIESYVFYYCTSLKSVILSDGIVTIKGGAFEHTSISSLMVPSTVQIIESSAFRECENLTNIVFSSSETVVNNNAFYQNNINKIEYLADDIALKGPLLDVSSLGIDTIIVSAQAYPFLTENSEWEKCDRIFARGADKNLYLGIRNDYNSIVGVNGVYDKNLILVPHNEEAVLQRANSSPNEMYVMMNGESSVLTPDNPKMIVKPSSFHSLAYNVVYAIDRNMSGNNDYTISMTSSGTLLSQIGRNNLEKVKRLKVIGDINGTDILAIRKMSTLEELDLSEANIVNGGSSYLSEYTTSANEIGAYFFKDISNLILLHLPESGKRIKRNVFDGCTKLQEVILPGSFTDIEENAFSNSGIKKVVFKDSENSIFIDKTAFANTFISSLELYRDYETSLSRYDAYYIFGNKGALKLLTIDGHSTKVDDYVFTNCNTLSSLIIGSKVKRIGSGNFANCASLEKVIFKDSETELELSGSSSDTRSFGFFGNSPIKELYCGRNIRSNQYGSGIYGTFMNLPYLTDLTISEHVTEIVRGQFKDDTGLKKVILPNSITHIERYAFDGCILLAELSMPSQLEAIGDGAFANCECLKNIEIPASVTYIWDQAFENCKALTKINIGNNVSSIYSKTFKGCSSLQEIRLGDKVTSIGSNAFDDCSKITTFYSLNPTPPTVNSTSLSGINRSACTLYVPKGSGDTYWLHPEWELFFDIREVETSSINSISKHDDTPSSYYTLGGKQMGSLTKGINIVKMNDGTVKKVVVK